MALELVPRTAVARAHTHPLALTTSHTITAGKAAEGAYGLRPQDLRNAYFPGEQPGAPVSEPQKIALVDAYNDFHAEADLKTYDEELGLPECTTANGCFRQVNEKGESGNLPFPSSEQSREATEKVCVEASETVCEELERAAEWSGEISLDIETAHAVCQNCHILLVEADTAEWADIEAAENTAVRLGADEISNSLAGEEPPADSEAFNHPGTVITAASGDFGYLNWGATKGEEERYGIKVGEVSYPASSPHVVAVGGTSLTLNGPALAWSGESVWRGSGSGCSAHFLAGEWQRDAPDWLGVGCKDRRAISDVSADADPNSGVAAYDSFPESFKVAGKRERVITTRGWHTSGGTSLASPIIAAMFALAGGSHGMAYPAQTLYSHLGSALLHDIAEGSNGKCEGNYASGCTGSMSSLSLTDCGQEVWICNAAPGYDGPSGVGTPNGIAALQPIRKHTWSGGPEAPITEACAGAADATEGRLRVCGTLNPNASAKSGYYFVYNKGVSCTAGEETPLQLEVEGKDIGVSGELFGLEPATRYAYCLIATNPSGETEGPTLTFTTKPAPPRAPEIGLITNITGDSAMLEGRLKREAHQRSWYFEYAPGPNCTGAGAKTTPEEEEAPQSEPIEDVHTEITGLQPSTVYTLCLIAKSAGGSTSGSGVTFKTLPASEVKGESKAEAKTLTTGTETSLVTTILPTIPVVTPATSVRASTNRRAFSDLKLPAVQHGDLLLVGLTVDLAGSEVVVDVTAPAAQVSSAKKGNKRKPVVLARLVRENVALGRLKLTVPLNAKGKRELKRHKHLMLTVKIIVTPPAGNPQTTVTHTVTLGK